MKKSWLAVELDYLTAAGMVGSREWRRLFFPYCTNITGNSKQTKWNSAFDL